MKVKNLGLWILIAVGAVIIIYIWSTYNGLVGLNENVQSKWANVESDFQRRSDLIPNLVNTVKGVANFEKSTLTEIIQARASATQIKVSSDDLSEEKIRRFQQAQGQLSAALGKLLMISENYPQLKSTEAFVNLQSQLEGTENRINVSRKDFNEVVLKYNSRIKRFPANLVAKIGGFNTKGYFEAVSGSDKAPEVKF